MDNFIKVNTDLHMHGLYSGAVSSKMIPKVIAEQAPLEGLNLVGTADILHEKWINLVKEQLKTSKDHDGLLEHENNTKFILQTEIEDTNRVHHVPLFPEFSKVYELRELKKISPKPNTKYKITKKGNLIKKKIKDYKKQQYKEIKNDFIKFCKTLKKFDLWGDSWYENLR